MPQMKGLTAICSGMAGYTTYGVISAERKKAICDFLCANGPYVTPATSNNLYRRTIRANACTDGMCSFITSRSNTLRSPCIWV